MYVCMGCCAGVFAHSASRGRWAPLPERRWPPAAWPWSGPSSPAVSPHGQSSADAHTPPAGSSGALRTEKPHESDAASFETSADAGYVRVSTTFTRGCRSLRPLILVWFIIKQLVGDINKGVGVIFARSLLEKDTRSEVEMLLVKLGKTSCLRASAATTSSLRVDPNSPPTCASVELLRCTKEKLVQNNSRTSTTALEKVS